MSLPALSWRFFAPSSMVLLLALAGCPGGESGTEADGGGSFTVGVNVTGLAGTLVVANNADTLTITQDGTSTFATMLSSGQSYDVTVETHPDGQECSVTGGNGTASADVIANVNCAAAEAGYYVGGTVSGLAGTLVLLNNSGDALSITASGSFQFATRLADGAPYAVTVESHPAGQFCNVSEGSGAIAGASIISVAVVCAAKSLRLTKRGITTEAPSVVKAAVHVHHTANGAAITGLTVDDFEVLEDGVAVSASESFLDLAPTDAIPYTLKTVLAIDVSASLTLADVAQVKQTVRNLLIDPVTLASRLLPNQQVAIYTFDDTVALRIDFSSDVAALLAAVDAITRGGPSTNLYGAIVTGAGRWTDSYTLTGIVNGALIVITDGNDTAGISTKAQAITATNGKQVFAVPVGSEADGASLIEIAGADHVVPATDFGQLQTILADVVDRMAHFADGLYFLYYATPKRSGTHTLTVSVRGNQNTGTDATISGTFSATGFSNVVPEIVKVGPAEVGYATSVTWEVRTRWSNDPPNYTWGFADPDGWLQVTDDGVTSDGRGEFATIVGTGAGCGSKQVTLTDLNHSLSITTPLTVRCVPVTSLALGDRHGCAIAVDGTIKCWGNNSSSQLGDGTTTSRNKPKTIAGLRGVQLGLGTFHSCMVQDDGTVRCWGNNGEGQLGDGTTTGGTAPGAVSGLDSAVAVAAGQYHTCALVDGGTVRCWGRNDYGQLGDGTTTARLVPVAVADVSNVVQLAVGGETSCALRGDGSVTCWGRFPVALTGVAEISLRAFNGCARMTNRTVRCWGYNNFGQLGNGTTNTGTWIPPVTVTGIDTAASVSVGGQHVCATLLDGRAKCWGRNNSGQLGDGSTTDRTTPVFVGLSSALSTAGGLESTCAVLTGGAVRCWGLNSSGQLGDGTNMQRTTPALVLVTTN